MIENLNMNTCRFITLRWTPSKSTSILQTLQGNQIFWQCLNFKILNLIHTASSLAIMKTVGFPGTEWRNDRVCRDNRTVIGLSEGGNWMCRIRSTMAPQARLSSLTEWDGSNSLKGVCAYVQGCFRKILLYFGQFTYIICREFNDLKFNITFLNY